MNDVSTLPAALDLSDAALLVVDMQYFDAHRDWGEGRTAKELGVATYFDDYFRQIDDITPRIAALLDASRARRVEVMHLRVAELTCDSRDVGLKQLVRGLVVPADSKEAEFLEGLEPQGDEIVISKSASGVFPSTSFDRTLRNIGIRTLIFTGTSTSGCVQSAIYDALDLGYRVVLVADACADATMAAQAQALQGLRGLGVEVVSSTALLRVLEAMAPLDPARRSGLARVAPYLPTQPFLPNDRPAAEVSPYALIFGPAIRLHVTPRNAALVLVDVQHAFCDPSAAFAPRLSSMAGHDGFHARAAAALPRMVQLRDGLAAAGMPVVHVRTAAHMADGRDLAARLRRHGLRLVAGERDADFMPQLRPGPGQAVLTKPGSGIFTGTGLDELLRNLGAEHVVLAGIGFDGALEASIRSAGDRGYGVLLVPDACVATASVERNLWSYEKGTVNVRTVQNAVAQIAAG
jgi:nicotinamidase-related amidase